MTVHKIKVEVTGETGNKVMALAALLEEMEYYSIKESMQSLSIETLIKIAKIIHGTIYMELGV